MSQTQTNLTADTRPTISARMDNLQHQQLYKCPFCPCVFLTLRDQHLHMQAFTAREDRHRILWHDQMKRRENE